MPELPWYPTKEKAALARSTYQWATDVALREVTAKFINWITSTAKTKATIAQLNQDKEKYSGIWFSTFLAGENRDRVKAEREEAAERELTREERLARKRAERNKVSE